MLMAATVIQRGNDGIILRNTSEARRLRTELASTGWKRVFCIPSLHEAWCSTQGYIHIERQQGDAWVAFHRLG